MDEEVKDYAYKKERVKYAIIKYSITILIGALMCFGVILLRGAIPGPVSRLLLLLALADGFSVPGLLITLFGALVWVSSNGAFDAITYFFVNTFNVLFTKKHETYYDYKLRKTGKEPMGVGFLLIVGLGFLAVGVFFTIQYMRLAGKI